MRSAGPSAVVAIALCGCLPSDAGAPPSDTVVAASAASRLDAGRRIYNFRCYYCHGYSGDARTLASTFLRPPPRDFTSGAQPPRASMMAAVRDGKPGTAMQGFGSVLAPAEIEAVTDFIREAFVDGKARNTRYHTPENGWPDHERYAAAFPFATGRIALDTPWEDLPPEQAAGRRLYMGACVSCHDRGRVNDEGPAWELRSVSHPPNADACAGCHVYSRLMHGRPNPDSRYGAGSGRGERDPGASAGPFSLHDTPPRTGVLTAHERRGERLFLRNCAFCHAADGSGRNWIGAFIEPHPRNLADRDFMSAMTRRRLAAVIRDGLTGTSMPAWKSVLRENEIEAIVAYLSSAFGPIDP